MALGHENYIDTFQRLGAYGPHRTILRALGELTLAIGIATVLTWQQTTVRSLVLHHPNNPR